MNAALQETRPSTSRAKKLLRTAALLALVIAGAWILTVATSRTDYIEYWTSAKLLLHRVNPYSPTHVFALEKAQGYSDSRPLVMLNPPWTMFLIAPLGLFSLRAGLFLWTLATIACVGLSVWLLEIPQKERAFAYVFAPAVAAVFMGQSSTFLLLGFSLFLRFHRSRPFWAGASLLLMAIKPHLFFVFWAVLLVDCVHRRAFRMIAGGVAALGAATAFSLCFDPHIYQNYLAMMRGFQVQQVALPTLSMLFRMAIDVRAFWLLFVPSGVAVLWGLWYYRRWSGAWDWKTHGMLLMLIAILCSPYSWLTDEAVLLPVILCALQWPEKPRYAAWSLLAINTVILLVALGDQADLISHAYMWTPVAWVAWFLYATRGFQLRPASTCRSDIARQERFQP